MQQVASATVLQEVTLELQTDITAIARMHSRAVAEAGQLAHGLRITHETLVNRVHRVLVGERSLELTQLYAEEI